MKFSKNSLIVFAKGSCSGLSVIARATRNPPEHATVLCADEKNQIQALDRTHPGLPLKPGGGNTMTHDYSETGPRRCLRC